jgi:hypothetical protein
MSRPDQIWYEHQHINSILRSLHLYDGDKEVEDRGLTIGGYESAWLADLAMAFLLTLTLILETIDQKVLDETKYFGIYCDDGIAVFPGTWTQTGVEDWLSAFQTTINDKAGNNKLSFTAEVWTPGGDNTTKPRGSKVGTHTTDHFPFLDMELSWSDEGTLKFGVHLKPNQPTAQISQCRESSHPRLLQSNYDWSLLPTDQADHNR